MQPLYLSRLPSQGSTGRRWVSGEDKMARRQIAEFVIWTAGAATLGLLPLFALPSRLGQTFLVCLGVRRLYQRLPHDSRCQRPLATCSHRDLSAPLGGRAVHRSELAQGHLVSCVTSSLTKVSDVFENPVGRLRPDVGSSGTLLECTCSGGQVCCLYYRCLQNPWWMFWNPCYCGTEVECYGIPCEPGQPIPMQIPEAVPLH